VDSELDRQTRAQVGDGRAGGAQTARAALSKVPEVTVYFWIAKVLTTGMGETTSDYLVHRLGPPTAVTIGAIGLTGGLVLQFRASRYSAWIYWLAVAMVSLAGTIAADVLHVQFGVPYAVSTVFFVVALAVVFAVWYASEKTLSIHSISTVRRELFYWATILTTFALGTAAGDMTATTWHLGYFSSGVLFAVLIAIPALAYWRFRLNAILAFWSAYIVTRPLGASFADWLAVPARRRGLNLGDGPVSFVLAALIVGVVAYLATSGKDTRGREVGDADAIAAG
jgi:uncharacterized membrane-anchored protein